MTIKSANEDCLNDNVRFGITQPPIFGLGWLTSIWIERAALSCDQQVKVSLGEGAHHFRGDKKSNNV
jgi:hypothetical protein